MKLLRILPLLILPLAFAQAETSPAKTWLAERGASIYSDDLATAPDGKTWRAAKGKWDIADGAVRGAEVPDEKHGAVIRHALPLKNAVIQFDVKFDGAKSTSVSINDAKDHLARVILGPTGFTVQKDDNDHEGPDKAVPFGRRNVKLAEGEWHTVVVEFVGDTMLASVNGANPTFGSHEIIATQKANIGFTVAGQTASFRNLRVWDATEKKDWATVKGTIPPAPLPGVPAAKAAAAKAAAN